MSPRSAVGGRQRTRDPTRGLHEFVRLDRVMALSASVRRNDPNSRRGALRARLADAADHAKDIAELQQLARDREGKA